ncbi:MAG TPA: hypothetical protein VGD60_12405 [Candidatus Acidoferrales bacterium]
MNFSETKTARRTTARLIALALILCIGVFAVQAAGHWHGHESDEQHCRVCHVGHVAVPLPAMQVALLAPIPVARFAPTTRKVVRFETFSTHYIPRGPPA